VPVNVLAPANLLATLGFGKLVRRSGCALKAADLSARDLGFSSSSSLFDAPVGAGDMPEDGGPAWAFARIAAISTFPTGSYAPLTTVGRSSLASRAWARMAAMSTLPTGWYAPLTTSGRSFCEPEGWEPVDSSFLAVSSAMLTLVGV